MQNMVATTSMGSDAALDKRTERRRRTFAAATIVLDNRMSTFDVVVRNRSGKGFLLKAENPTLIPREFSLRLAGERSEYRCEVVRRSQNALGIKVVDYAGARQAASGAVLPPEPQDELRAKIAARFPHLAKS